MANPTCTSTTVVTDATPYRLDSDINQKQQKCLLIYGMVLELAAIGGTDYTSVMDSTLISDSFSLTHGMSNDQIKAAAINLQFVNAAAAGGTVPSTMLAKLQAIAKLLNLPDPVVSDTVASSPLDRILLNLQCKLGIHKAYVQ